MFCGLLLRVLRLLPLLLLVAAATSAVGAQERDTQRELERFFEAEGIAFIAQRGDNVEHLYSVPRVVGDDTCVDPAPPPGDPYTLREDLDGDGASDAVELGLRDSTVVVVACLTVGSGCHADPVAPNSPLRTWPRCTTAEAELAGYNLYRVSAVEPEERARWLDLWIEQWLYLWPKRPWVEPWPEPSWIKTWSDLKLPVFRLDDGLGARYYCVSPDGFRVCGWVN